MLRFVRNIGKSFDDIHYLEYPKDAKFGKKSIVERWEDYIREQLNVLEPWKVYREQEIHRENFVAILSKEEKKELKCIKFEHLTSFRDIIIKYLVEYPKGKPYDMICPHCSHPISITKKYPLIGKETKRNQCPKCHMSLMPIEYYTKKCSYCGEIMPKEQIICKFCGNNKQRTRHISAQVKREVWRRDHGKCVECGSNINLEYDHIIPFSKGGSNTTRNIQLLCEVCNRKKYDKIE